MGNVVKQSVELVIFSEFEGGCVEDLRELLFLLESLLVEYVLVLLELIGEDFPGNIPELLVNLSTLLVIERGVVDQPIEVLIFANSMSSPLRTPCPPRT